MKRAIELTVWAGLLLTATLAGAQGRPQTPPPPPPGVMPQPVGRGGETTSTGPASPTSTAPRPTGGITGAGTVRPPAGSNVTPTPAAQPSRPAAAVSPATTEPAPTETQLGVPIFPGAKFLQSYDAGQNQRYYLFGATAPFGELVLYYRTQLKERGDLVYDEPPVHMFEVGRFREESMAFPPGVTIKDYTWGGKKGFLVPTPGANPSHYPTVIQIVPVTSR
ncbi:MAG TPA: hypothetical protein VMF13_20155 [Luteitalea sp.]|nr:hypothetical protein [Luteitalea sp.]